MKVTLFVLLMLLVLSWGCASRKLTPAPQAHRVSGVEDAAQRSDNGVVLIVRPDHWDGEPSDLRRLVLPVRMEVRNESGKPLQIAYRHFGLTTGSGFHAAPIPPFRMQASIPNTAPRAFVHPWFGWHGFYLSRYYSPFYGPGWGPWRGRWAFDGNWYNGYSTWRESLPSEDMLRKALPEGVLQEGGGVTGYLYFQKLPESAMQATFTARFADPDSEQLLAQMQIPFVVTEK